MNGNVEVTDANADSNAIKKAQDEGMGLAIYKKDGATGNGTDSVPVQVVEGKEDPKDETVVSNGDGDKNATESVKDATEVVKDTTEGVKDATEGVKDAASTENALTDDKDAAPGNGSGEGATSGAASEGENKDDDKKEMGGSRKKRRSKKRKGGSKKKGGRRSRKNKKRSLKKKK